MGTHKRERSFIQELVCKPLFLLFLSTVFSMSTVWAKKVSDSTKTSKSKLEQILKRAQTKEKYDQEFKEILALGDQTIPELIKHFKNPSNKWQSRWICAQVLGKMGGDESQEALMRGLKDKLFLIRLASVKALTPLQGKGIASALEKMLSDKAMVVRSEAALAIAQRGSTSSVEALTRELFESRNFHRGKSLWVREDILKALGNLKSRTAIPAIVKVLREDERKLRLSACDALSKIEPEIESTKISKEKNKNCWESWILWFEGEKKDTEEVS